MIYAYHIVQKYIHDQTRENAILMTVELLQAAQDTIARQNKTTGIDKISPEEMDLQRAINVIQNL